MASADVESPVEPHRRGGGSAVEQLTARAFTLREGVAERYEG